MTRIKIRTRESLQEEAANAKIYVGKNLIGSLPSSLVASKDYVFDCDAYGESVKVVSGTTDYKLAFSMIDVWLLTHDSG